MICIIISHILKPKWGFLSLAIEGALGVLDLQVWGDVRVLEYPFDLEGGEDGTQSRQHIVARLLAERHIFF